MSGERQTVAGAHAKIDAHEAVCAERYKNIHGRLDDVKRAQGRHELATWGLLVAILGFLATQAYNDLKHPPAAIAAAVALPAPR
jgi:hypothetical protein